MEDRDFQVSSVTTVATEAKVDAAFMEEWLNQNFRLADYGRGLDHLFVVFTVTDNEQRSYYQFHPEERMLELILPIPEKQLRQAELPEVLELMSSSLLATLRGIDRLVLPEYDLPALCSGVEAMVK